MTQPIAKEKYVLTFPKDDEGNEIKFRFMLTLSRKLNERMGGLPNGNEETIESRLGKALSTLDGIDGITGGGRYTIEIVIARSFDPDDVITELKRRLEEDVLTDIIKPSLVY